MNSTGKISAGKIIFILFFLSSLSYVQGRSTEVFFNVVDYGMTAGNEQPYTVELKELIEEVHSKGGGTIFFPAGVYLMGPIHLKSNITLYLDAGSVLRFSDNFDDYLPMVQSRFEGVDLMSFSPLIYAYEAENIAIIGNGTLDGQGKKWWDFHHELYSKPADYKSKWQEEFHRQNEGMLMPDNSYMFDRGFCRPPFIQAMHCSRVRIEGIKIINSPFWTINPEFCDNVTISSVTIENPPSPNTDGINPESCTNVHISDCHISVGDDCITIKSGKDEPGRLKNAPAENYTITNCTMLSGHGGVVIGSEMSGGVRNITISNCIFDGTDRGIRIKSARGRGGIVEDIRVSNIVMRNIKKEAIKLNLMYAETEPEPVSERTPRFRDIHISGVTGNATQAISITGLEEMPVENVSFSNINLDSRKGVELNHVKNVVFHRVAISPENGAAFYLKNCSTVEFDACTGILAGKENAFIRLENVMNAWIHNCHLPGSCKSLVDIHGKRSAEIALSGNYLPRASELSTIAAEVAKDVIIHIK